jgi:hypothetical protein
MEFDYYYYYYYYYSEYLLGDPRLDLFSLKSAIGCFWCGRARLKHDINLSYKLVKEILRCEDSVEW